MNTAKSGIFGIAALLCIISHTAFSQRRSSVSSRPVSSSITIVTEPNATIWIDEIRRGITDASGRLELKSISPGRHVLRVRATGFRETSSPLIGVRRNVIVKLVRTTDRAELTFQQAEEGREKAKRSEEHTSELQSHSDL